MKYESLITVTCNCGKIYSHKHEFEAINDLFNHIIVSHPKIKNQLEKLGRKKAMCQNGLGYFDDGKSKCKDSGWFRAQDTFREAWMEHALEDMLKNK